MNKIWIISKYGSLPEQNGPQRQFSIAKNLSEKFHDTTLIISKSNSYTYSYNSKKFYYNKIYNNLNVIILNGPIIKLGFSIKRIISWFIFEINLLRYAKYVKKDKYPEVIIVSSLSFFTLITGVFLKNKFKSKLIIEIRDIWPLSLVEIGGFNRNNIFIKLLFRLEKFSIKNADGIVGTMPKLDNYIKSIINSPFKFKYIPMGYSNLQFKSLSNCNTSIFSYPLNKFIVGYAGTIGKANLVEEIVKASKILENNSKIYFVIFGDGPLKNSLLNLTKNQNNIKFFGSISKYEIIPELSNCNILISPINSSKLYNYGISFNKWIDYMLSSRPILACYSGYKNILIEENCGFFIEPNRPDLLAEKIIELSHCNKEILDNMGENGFNYVCKFHNYEYLTNQYYDFIINL